MSKNKYKWFFLGLTSVVISGCSVGSKPNLNLGIADAFQKSKSCLFKKKVSYRTPASGTNFGYAPATISSVADASIVVPDEPHSSSCGCGCNADSVASGSVTDFYMPPQEVVAPTVESEGGGFLPVVLPLDAAEENFELHNPLPAAMESPSTSTIDVNPINPTEEEGFIETLDSAAIEVEVDEKMEDFKVPPQKVESSILDTALQRLNSKPPTSAGDSVVEQRSKMLTLTARPAQSHQSAESLVLKHQSKKVEMQQVTHKRHYRQQNALRPLHHDSRGEPLEHTAEAPGPLTFKPLPAMSTETLQNQTSDNNTGAPALNPSRSQTLQQPPKTQPLPGANRKLESETQTDEESVIKVARLPILRAESTTSAAISSLKNFTNVRDLNPEFDRGFFTRKKAETATLKAVQVISDDDADSNDKLTLER